VSVGDLGNGRLGLSSGDVNERLSFATTLADDDGPGRILHAAVDPALIPGEMRSGPGFFYRLLVGQGTTLDEVWLPEQQAGDETLAEALHGIATGADLRPGTALAPFAIDWVVLEGPQFVLDQILVAQLDLVPTPLDPQARVYENVNSSPLAGNQDIPWVRAGMGYQGEAIEGTVRIATNHHSGWSPDAAPEDWGLTVAGDDGVATFRPSGVNLFAAISTLIVVLAALSMLILGRRVSR
jgi:hypothetical protein